MVMGLVLSNGFGFMCDGFGFMVMGLVLSNGLGFMVTGLVLW